MPPDIPRTGRDGDGALGEHPETSIGSAPASELDLNRLLEAEPRSVLWNIRKADWRARALHARRYRSADGGQQGAARQSRLERNDLVRARLADTRPCRALPDHLANPPPARPAPARRGLGAERDLLDAQSGRPHRRP